MKRCLVPLWLALCTCQGQLVDTAGGSSPADHDDASWTSALPLGGGQLAVAPSGAWAVATDPSADALHLVRLTPELSTRRVSFERVALPARATLTDTTAYVTLVASGQIAVVDLESASVTERVEVCPDPEGLYTDASVLHVACRGGLLASFAIDATAPTSLRLQREIWLDDGLRDVVPWAGGLAVSRLGTAEVLVLDADGAPLRRLEPATPDGTRPGVAWRLVPGKNGKLLLAHQVSSTRALFGVYYGGGCSSITSPAISVLDPDPPDPSTGDGDPSLAAGADSATTAQILLANAAGTLDIAPSQDGLVVAVPGNALATRHVRREQGDAEAELLRLSSIFPVDPQPGGWCVSPEAGTDESVVPLSLAAIPAGPLTGHVLVLTQTPAELKIHGTDLRVSLGDEASDNLGLELFQMTVSRSISCASCHPLGRADAHVWNFASHGPRRTQSLEGGVSHLAPFHWDGEFPSWDKFVEKIMNERMGLGEPLSPAAQGSLLRFVDEVPAALPSHRVDPDAVERGRALFHDETTECGTCHSGPHLTDHRLYDVGTGGDFVTPSLRGVGYRAPLMHDGCARDLTARFGLCGGGDAHGKTSQLTPEEIADLVAYMTTL